MSVAAARQPGAEHEHLGVLLVDAGLTKLTAAGAAIRHGLTVWIVGHNSTRSTLSKASVAHARTLQVSGAKGQHR